MYRMLIVEDDLDIARAIGERAGMWDLQTHIAEDFRDVMGKFAACQPHIVVLDIALPFFNGYHWCREIRRVSRVPILFLSSAADHMNIIMAVEMGADDFIAKPFDLDVLIAKIQALLRRTYDFGAVVPVLEHRGAVFNPGDGTLIYGENTVVLTRNEAKILLCLLENKGRVVSREKLMERLWKTETFIDENTLTVNVNRLRRKLDGVGLEHFITTRFRAGYLIEQGAGSE